jgi:hypothetical protein
MRPSIRQGITGVRPNILKAWTTSAQRRADRVSRTATGRRWLNACYPDDPDGVTTEAHARQ